MYNWIKCKYYDDARYFYETLEGCTDFKDEISKEVVLRQEWLEFVRLRGYRKVGIVTRNYTGLTMAIKDKLESKNDLEGISLSLCKANEIEVIDGKFTSKYQIYINGDDLTKSLNSRPFINYDVQKGRIFVKNG